MDVDTGDWRNDDHVDRFLDKESQIYEKSGVQHLALWFWMFETKMVPLDLSGPITFHQRFHTCASVDCINGVSIESRRHCFISCSQFCNILIGSDFNPLVHPSHLTPIHHWQHPNPQIQ